MLAIVGLNGDRGLGDGMFPGFCTSEIVALVEPDSAVGEFTTVGVESDGEGDAGNEIEGEVVTTVPDASCSGRGSEFETGDPRFSDCGFILDAESAELDPSRDELNGSDTLGWLIVIVRPVVSSVSTN